MLVREVASPPIYGGAGMTVLLKASPRITTPRESLGAVASRGAAMMTPRRHLAEDARPTHVLAGMVTWEEPAGSFM